MRQSGIRISTVYKALIVAAALISIALLYAAFQTHARFDSTYQAMEKHIIWHQDAEQFEEGFDYLSDESRLFLVTGDPAHVKNYVEEKEATRRRESVLKDAPSFMTQEESLHYLNVALKLSNELVQVEGYAIRLMISGMGYDPASFPRQISEVELTAEDAALDMDAQRSAAMDMLFSSAYTDKINAIHENVRLSIDALAEETKGDMLNNARILDSLLRRETILIMVLLALILATVLITSLLIIRPLYRNIRLLDQREEMLVTGAYEMKHLAQVYNDILAENNERNEKLSYSATHDALTGLNNRTAYEKAYKALRNNNVCVLVIDIDGFKQFNDTYGHHMGDLVLKRVARVISSVFRSEDHISRIGGDEFCVIMRNADSRLTDLVRAKVNRMNHVLSVPEDGTPAITLSVGIAFCDRKNPTDDIFKDADAALYRVKNNGKGSFGIYE